MGESLVLDIEDFAEKAACGADLAGFVGGISAFGADEMNIFTHFMASLFFFLDNLKGGIPLVLRYLMVLQGV